MRFPRVKAEGQSFYHCVSRVVDGRFIFQTTGHGSPEAERFVLLMRRLEAFSGVRVLNTTSPKYIMATTSLESGSRE
jgi:hypothetical protein